MAVTYYNFEQNATDIPSDTGATTYTRGFNGVGGTLQSLLIRLQLTTAGAPSIQQVTQPLLPPHNLGR